MNKWKVRVPGRQPIGPVSTELVVRGIQVGKIPLAAEVCEVGSEAWSALAQVDEFYEAMGLDDAKTNVMDQPAEVSDPETDRLFGALTSERAPRRDLDALLAEEARARELLDSGDERMPTRIMSEQSLLGVSSAAPPRGSVPVPANFDPDEDDPTRVPGSPTQGAARATSGNRAPPAPPSAPILAHPPEAPRRGSPAIPIVPPAPQAPDELMDADDDEADERRIVSVASDSIPPRAASPAALPQPAPERRRESAGPPSVAKSRSAKAGPVRLPEPERMDEMTRPSLRALARQKRLASETKQEKTKPSLRIKRAQARAQMVLIVGLAALAVALGVLVVSLL